MPNYMWPPKQSRKGDIFMPLTLVGNQRYREFQWLRSCGWHSGPVSLMAHFFLLTPVLSRTGWTERSHGMWWNYLCNSFLLEFSSVAHVTLSTNVTLVTVQALRHNSHPQIRGRKVYLGLSIQSTVSWIPGRKGMVKRSDAGKLLLGVRKPRARWNWGGRDILSGWPQWPTANQAPSP